VAAQNISQDAENKNILAQQRLNRPVAPHLSIYAAQIPWYLSGLNRITGCTLSGAFYVFGSLYLIAPYVGLNMTSASMAAAFGAWPVALKVMLKGVAAWPFTFHCFNGVRHLIWDTTYMITNKKVIQSGWTVVALSTISALALAVM
jgi:succinate dehydrogenase (ubiquinone) cytochrome b560 subunit